MKRISEHSGKDRCDLTTMLIKGIGRMIEAPVRKAAKILKGRLQGYRDDGLIVKSANGRLWIWYFEKIESFRGYE